MYDRLRMLEDPWGLGLAWRLGSLSIPFSGEEQLRCRLDDHHPTNPWKHSSWNVDCYYEPHFDLDRSVMGSVVPAQYARDVKVLLQ